MGSGSPEVPTLSSRTDLGSGYTRSLPQPQEGVTYGTIGDPRRAYKRDLSRRRDGDRYIDNRQLGAFYACAGQKPGATIDAKCVGSTGRWDSAKRLARRDRQCGTEYTDWRMAWHRTGTRILVKPVAEGADSSKVGRAGVGLAPSHLAQGKQLCW